MAAALLELKPERVSPYLRYITEGVLLNSKNEGSLRKDIWKYLMDHYPKDVDYQEFLIAIRRFTNDGKMINKEGFFSMHPEVVIELEQKTTPVRSGSKKSNAPESFSVLPRETFKAIKHGAASAKKTLSQYQKQSVAGKRQIMIPLQSFSGKDSAKQSKI
jgi:hypothetical protein